MACPDIFPDVVTHLYTRNRSAIDGAVEMYWYEVYAVWNGPGTLTLTTNVQAAGAYRLALCCSVLAEAVDVAVEIAGRRVEARLHPTWGVWPVERPEYNFERVPLAGAIDLPEGPCQVKITVTGPEALSKKALNVSSLELTPVAAEAAIEAEELRFRHLNADPTAFIAAGYGLMHHWTSDTPGRDGNHKAYAQAVADFDLPRWVDMVERTGARYAFITANHGSPHFPGPLKFWESVHPGWTTRRDLVAEMIEALGARGIGLGLYLNSPTFGSLSKERPDPPLERYFDLQQNMFTEVGERYGRGIIGYWLDSWYQPFVMYGRFPIQRLYPAVKAGNKDRMVAFNHWVFPVPTLCQDYWAAECYKTLPATIGGPRYERGCAAGLQYHALLAADEWGIPAPGAKPAVWPGEVLAEFVKRAVANRGVVTVNLGIYQDGTISDAITQVMDVVRKTVRG